MAMCISIAHWLLTAVVGIRQPKRDFYGIQPGFCSLVSYEYFLALCPSRSSLPGWSFSWQLLSQRCLLLAGGFYVSLLVDTALEHAGSTHLDGGQFQP